MLVYALSSVASGALFDALGPRLTFPLGAVLLGTGLIFCSRVESIFGLYIYYGVIIGVAFSLLGFIPHMALITRWFVRRRGLASAVALSGIGTGSLTMAMLSESLIVRFGWRDTFFYFGVAAIVLLIPLTALLHRDHPSSMGIHPDGDASPAKASGTSVSVETSLGMVIKKPAFWLLFLSVTLIGLNNQTFAVHQTRLFMDIGYPFPIAAALFGLTGLFRSIGGMIWGGLSDKIGRRPCIIFGISMGLAALVFLISTRAYPHVWVLAAFVVLWGLGFNGLPPLYAASVGDLFQGRHIGKIFGLLDMGFGLGSAAGPWATGLLFDQIGSYDAALWAMLITTLVCGMSLWWAAPRSQRS